MDRKSFAITAGIGFVTLVMLFLVAIPAAFLLSSSRVKRLPKDTQQFDNQPSQGAESLAPSDPDVQLPQTGEDTSPSVIPAQPNRASTTLVDLYQSLHPGVVNIRLSSQHSPEPSLNGGSGFIYDDLGYIVASNHVVAGAAEAVVMFFNGDEVIAKVVGADRYTDLAVVRVSGLPEGTYPLQLGDSDQVQVGESVLAIGNVSGTGGSLNTGIIRAIGKPFSSTTDGLDRFQRFQTDMSTGLDLSGSPLVNLRGEVIGVNTYIPDQSDLANTKVGYAIPANILQRLVPELIRRGVYEWPWLGLNGVSVSLEITEANNLKTQRGVYITKVLTDGPAAKAGLSGSKGITGGDIIIAADSDPINEYVDLLNHIAFKDPGDKVLLTIIRDGQIKDITVILEPRPEDAGTGST